SSVAAVYDRRRSPRWNEPPSLFRTTLDRTLFRVTLRASRRNFQNRVVPCGPEQVRAPEGLRHLRNVSVACHHQKGDRRRTGERLKLGRVNQQREIGSPPRRLARLSSESFLPLRSAADRGVRA